MDSLQDILINDERKGKFKWMWEYNSEVNVKLKMQIDSKSQTKYFHRLFILLMSALTVATTLLFMDLVYSDPAQIDIEIHAAQFMDPWSVLLAFLLEIYHKIFETLNIKFMFAYNYRFKKDFNDGLSWYLFFYSCFNFYFPLAAIALYKQSFISVFTILFTILLLEQGKNSLFRYFRPICFYKKRVDQERKKWKDWNEIEIPPQNEKIEHQILYNAVLMEDDQEISKNYMDLVT